MIENVKLMKGDCMELMKEIPDGSIDMILCDLPYGKTDCKWDSVIPFASLWEQYSRIIKANGAVVLFGSQPFTSKLVMSNIRGYKHHWVWVKNRGTGFQVAKYRPMMATEDIISFTANGERINYHPQMVKLEKPYFSRNASSSNGTNPLAHFNRGWKIVVEKHPLNIIQCAKEAKPIHPTQKPVALLEYLIKTYTNEGDTVLDNCMGSGSTGIACINTNRRFIGIELDEKYFEIAKNRISEANDIAKIIENQSKIEVEE